MFKIFSLYKSHIKGSKKIIIFSCIGLIIALTLVSSSLYFIDNSRQSLIDKYYNKNVNTGNDIIVNLQKQFHVDNKDVNTINDTINSIVTRYNFDFINNTETRVTSGFKGFQAQISQTTPSGGTFFQGFSLNVFQLTPYLKIELKALHNSLYGSKAIDFPSQVTDGNNSLTQAFMLYASFNYYSNLGDPSQAILRKGKFSFMDNFQTGNNYEVNTTMKLI